MAATAVQTENPPISAEMAKIALGLPGERKFEYTDMQGTLVTQAEEWLLNEHRNPTFEFLVEMRNELKTGRGVLSIGQAKGVWNCIRAQAMRERKASQPATPVIPVAKGRELHDGKYTVIFDSTKRLTLRVKTQNAKATFKPGEQIIGFLIGPDNTRNYKQFGTITGGELVVWSRFRDDSDLVEAVKVLINDPAAAATAYGIESAHCGICSLELTVPISVYNGIGPVCADNLGIIRREPPANFDEAVVEALANMGRDDRLRYFGRI